MTDVSGGMPHQLRPAALGGLGESRIRARAFRYEEVYRALQRALLSEQIPAGTNLTEGVIAEQLGVSRTPVREALRRLESEGFARRAKGGGLAAVRIAPQEVGDIFLIRGELDQLSARLAAERSRPEDWQEVHALLGGMEQAIATDGLSSEAFRTVHLALHTAIYELAFGPRLAVFLDTHVLKYLEVAAELSYVRPDPSTPAVKQHAALVAAIASGDPSAAAAAAAAHVQRSASDASSAQQRSADETGGVSPDRPSSTSGRATRWDVRRR